MVLTSYTLLQLLRTLVKPGNAARYLALSTTAPTEQGGNVTEPSGHNYSRLLLHNNQNASFADPVYDSETGYASIVNNKELHFNAATDGGFGTIVGWVVYDAQTGGNPIAYGNFATPIVVGEDNIAAIRSGAFSITVDADTLTIQANVGE